MTVTATYIGCALFVATAATGVVCHSALRAQGIAAGAVLAQQTLDTKASRRVTHSLVVLLPAEDHFRRASLPGRVAQDTRIYRGSRVAPILCAALVTAGECAQQEEKGAPADSHAAA